MSATVQYTESVPGVPPVLWQVTVPEPEVLLIQIDPDAPQAPVVPMAPKRSFRYLPGVGFTAGPVDAETLEDARHLDPL